MWPYSTRAPLNHILPRCRRMSEQVPTVPASHHHDHNGQLHKKTHSNEALTAGNVILDSTTHTDSTNMLLPVCAVIHLAPVQNGADKGHGGKSPSRKVSAPAFPPPSASAHTSSAASVHAMTQSAAKISL